MPRPSPIERAAAYVAKMPQAVSGSGGHNRTFAVACALVKGFDLTVDQARSILMEYNRRCDPPWSEAELEHKLVSAAGSADGEKGRGYLLGEVGATDAGGEKPKAAAPVTKPFAKPTFDAKALERFSEPWMKKVDLLWLANRSEVDPAIMGSQGFLSLLYTSREKVLVFDNDKTQGQAVWPDEPLPATGKNGVWFLAQPVDGEYYPNPRTKKMSRRSEESVTDWRWLVLESDAAPLRQWLGAIVQMPLRIAALYTSGGRSVHALIRIDARTKKHWDEVKQKMAPGLRYLVLNGADPGVLSAVRLTRLPFAMREGKWGKGGEYVKFPKPKLQKLLYVNSAPEPRPLVELFARRDVESDWLGYHHSRPEGEDEWVDEGLQYYAPVSERIRQTLESCRYGEEETAAA